MVYDFKQWFGLRDIFVLTLHLSDLNGILRADLTVDKSGLRRVNKSTHNAHRFAQIEYIQTHKYNSSLCHFFRTPYAATKQVSFGNVILEIMKLSLEILPSRLY